jgi:hypothetical protein
VPDARLADNPTMARMAVGWLAVAACYAPVPQPGAECAAGACPTGLVCDRETNTCELPGGAGTPDAPDAREIDAPPGVDCFGTFFELCPEPAIELPLEISDRTTIDTDASPRCLASVRDACVIAGTSVSITANLTAIGARPLVILATETLHVTARISVASARGELPGAGAGIDCIAGTAPEGLQGGPGGSFGTSGGAGGLASGDGVGPGAAPATAQVTSLRGGCAGSDGVGETPGSGGDGGGSVVLIAQALALDGRIDASGAGGGAAARLAGGGGGGSGGLVVLDAATIALSNGALVIANGGGGGEGATSNKSGNRGDDATEPGQPAFGGSGSSPKGGNGGNGAFATEAARPGDNGGQCGRGPVGGGGGGGGAGVIRVIPMQPLGGTVSPPAS